MASSGSYGEGSAMSSMDEYNTRDLDFSDLALDDSDGGQEGAKEGGTGPYAKHNYEVR